MGSVGFDAFVSPFVNMYGKGYAGAIIGTVPKILLSAGDLNADISPATTATVGYGFGGGGIIINRKLSLGFRLLTGEPEYKVTARVGGSPVQSKFKQPSSRFYISIGFIISLTNIYMEELG